VQIWRSVYWASFSLPIHDLADGYSLGFSEQDRKPSELRTAQAATLLLAHLTSWMKLTIQLQQSVAADSVSLLPRCLESGPIHPARPAPMRGPAILERVLIGIKLVARLDGVSSVVNVPRPSTLPQMSHYISMNRVVSCHPGTLRAATSILIDQRDAIAASRRNLNGVSVDLHV
jgi:hypothetical protein